MTQLRFAAFGAPLLALALQTPSVAALASSITVSGAWSRPVAAGLKTGVAYVTLRNTGAGLDRLLGASTPAAARVSLHQSMDMGGMMSMTPVQDGLALAPGGTVKLAPGGYHLMLEGLKAGLKRGARYPLTLRFAHAPLQTVDVQVRDAAP